MGFIDLMKAENDQRKTLTENGAIAYATAGKEILDFNFKLSSFRKMDAEEIKREFGKVYYEDPLTAVKYLFWARDVRGGAGERKVFRAGLLWLAENKPQVAKAILPIVPEYGRWDDLWVLLDTSLKNDVIALINAQIRNDMEAMG